MFRPTSRPKAVMLHPDMFFGHNKAYESQIPSLQNSVRMRSLKQHSSQIRYKKDYDTFYESDPSRQLALLRKTRLRRADFNTEAEMMTTCSDCKPARRRCDSLSLQGFRRGRLNLSDFVIDRVSSVFEAEKFNTSVVSADLKGILGEVNRVISTVTNAAGKLNDAPGSEVKKSKRRNRAHVSISLENPVNSCCVSARPKPVASL